MTRPGPEDAPGTVKVGPPARPGPRVAFPPEARFSGVINDPAPRSGAPGPLGLGSELYPRLRGFRVPSAFAVAALGIGVPLPNRVYHRKEVIVRQWGSVGPVHVGRQSVVDITFRCGHPRSRLIVGSYTAVARAHALTGNENDSILTNRRLKKSLLGEQEPASAGDIFIGHDVALGDDVTLLENAVVSDGAIVGARSLVKGVIPPYAIAAGAPARVLRYRFTPEEIALLLDSRWWELPPSVIKEQIPLFYTSDVRSLHELALKHRRRSS